jgi:hypothetical protein
MRDKARQVSLLFFGAVGAFLITLLVAAPIMRLVMWFSGTWSTPTLRVIVGAAALDLVKALGLLSAAWLIGPMLRLRSTIAAIVLVVLTYSLDLGLLMLIQQAHASLSNPVVLLTRGAMLALLVLVTREALRRRSPRPPCVRSG